VRRTLLFFSFALFPITFLYMSPAMAIGGTYEGVASSGLLWWGVVLVSSVVVGRSFCGYACPLGGCQEALHTALGRDLRTVRYLKAVKYAVWGAWVGLIAFFAVTRGGWRKVDVFYMNPGFPPYDRPAHIAFLVFVLLAAFSALAWGRRGFCHYLCFFAPLNILGTGVAKRLPIPRLHVRVVDRQGCTQCRRCSAACPMTLDVTGMVARGAVDHAECITCGSCAATCRAGALAYGFSREGRSDDHG